MTYGSPVDIATGSPVDIATITELMSWNNLNEEWKGLNEQSSVSLVKLMSQGTERKRRGMFIHWKVTENRIKKSVR